MRQSSGALELQSHRRASLQICGRPKEKRQRTAAVQNLADLQEAQIYGNSLPTRVLIVLPSARPAALAWTALTTGPMSFLLLAPSS